jgi:hypothetical protein
VCEVIIPKKIKSSLALFFFFFSLTPLTPHPSSLLEGIEFGLFCGLQGLYQYQKTWVHSIVVLLLLELSG